MCLRILIFLHENQLINGRQAMVIDMNKCIHCNDCITACAKTHDGEPKFRLDGKKSGMHMVASACMHCFDAVCLVGCPTNAIEYDLDNRIIKINNDTCIGCGICALSCPYNTIEMVKQRDKYDNFLLGENGKSVLKASKCDLCIDIFGGPACVRACPTSALSRSNFTFSDN